MAEITAALVKELREATGAGMMDCKKALVDTEGNFEAAITILREKGLGKAAKKADRLASEGLINVTVDASLNIATVSEINAETDFVAKNEGFINLTKDVTAHIQATDIQSVEALMKTTINGTVFEEYFGSKVATIGENLVVRRFATLKASANGLVNGYLHSNGRVGVVIAANCDSEKTAAAAGEFIRNLCMHAAAMKPSFLSYTELDSEFVEKETIGIKADIEKENEELKRLNKPLKRIPLFVSQVQLTEEVIAQARKEMEDELRAQGKPEQIWERIIPGQIERFIADNTQLDQQLTLLSQFYVMDDKKTIAQVVADKAKELGGTIELVSYIRFELGEGLEKRACDFASEVADQLK